MQNKTNNKISHSYNIDNLSILEPIVSYYFILKMLHVFFQNITLLFFQCSPENKEKNISNNEICFFVVMLLILLVKDKKVRKEQ